MALYIIKKVEKLYDRKAFLRVCEEFPDLSQEEMVRHHEEIMRSLHAQFETPARGRGRTRRGARKVSGGEGKGSTSTFDKVSIPRRTWSSGVRIEEITDQPQPQVPRVLIDPEQLQVQPAKNLTVFRDIKEPEGD